MGLMGCKGSKAVVASEPTPIKAAPKPIILQPVQVEEVQPFSKSQTEPAKMGFPSNQGPSTAEPNKAESIINKAMNRSEFEEDDDDELADVNRFLSLNKSESGGDELLLVPGTTTSAEISTKALGTRVAQCEGVRVEDSAQEHAAPRGSRPMEQEQPSMSAPADPEDPWASLQSAYRIADGRDPAPVGGTRGGSGKLGAKAPGSQATGSSLAAKGPQQQAEMVVLDDEEDDEFSSAMRTRMKAGVSGAGPGPGGAPRGRPSSNPKQGGWGQGEMAAAGTLMLGAEESFCTPGLVQAVVPVAGYAADQDDDVFGDGPVGCLQARPAAADVVFEDMEDVDVDQLLDDEMQLQCLGNKDLADKLKKFESQFDD